MPPPPQAVSGVSSMKGTELGIREIPIKSGRLDAISQSTACMDLD